MSAKQTPKGAEVQRYCQQWPRVPDLQLARMLVRDHAPLFDSTNPTEQARGLVRKYRGKSGARCRREMKVRVETTKADRLTVPKSSADPIIPHELACKGSGMVCGDLHLPYHDERALDLALNYAIQQGHTDYLILNGDIIDGHSISRFVKDPRARTFGDELATLREFLAECRRHFKAVVYKSGNHEARWWAYMRVKAPELVGIDELEFHNLVGFERLGVEYVDDTRPIYAGKLTIMHGHEYGRTMFSPVNPARGAFLRAHACAVVGHLHRGSYHPEPDVRGKLTACWSHGCLCDLHPHYAPLNKWDHSFLMMQFDGADWFELDLRRIVKGRIV